ncbi:DNA-processing protein DprA [Terribacillus saccharophilus]|uniref:DNA-processing protein DprA n=1 Tax=Terribacillus saccharophilus TaxID=361277 RepID=UPI0039819E75
MDKRKRLLLLHRVLRGRRKVMQHMLRIDPQLDNLLHASSLELTTLYQLPHSFAATLFQELQNEGHAIALEQDMQDYHTLTYFDEVYPPALRYIPDPPLVMYAVGKMELLSLQPAISVVGTRQPTKAAGEKIAYVLNPLLAAGWTIVSGMAKGIDSLAHHAALQAQGSTIAVLGSGLRHIYPHSNQRLYESLTATQLVLSEYCPDQQPLKHHFPERNRIVSGLGFCTLVVEAKRQSGTMHTVMHALEQGKDVFAIPGDPFKDQTEGCHQLIADGAGIIFEPGQLLDEWEHNKSKNIHFI